MANTRLLKTLGTPTNGQKFTWSAWVKRAKLGGDQVLFNANNAGSTNVTFRFSNNNRLYFFYLLNSSMIWQYETTAVYRDTNAWMHIVFAYDSTLGTNSERIKIYVNGTRVTDFDSPTHASSNVTNSMNSAVAHYIGDNGGNNQFDGCMSHIHFTDGYTYQASSFGSTDATTGEWKINTNPSVTYGNNGFFILKDGNSLTDQSPNSNNWAVDTGTLTKTEDNPSNVFCTINACDSYYQNSSLSEGNNKVAFNNGWAFNTGTLGFNSGKWYWEVRSNNWNAGNQAYGITSAVADAAGDEFYNNSGANAGYGLYNNGVIYGNGANLGGGYTASGNNYIGMIAVDADNNQIWFGANGSWETGSGPGSTGVSIANLSTTSSGFWFPAVSGGVNSSGNDMGFNFGNGYFGATQIASAGTNASGNGIFEYDVPTGFTALSTKGLNL